MEMMLGGLHIEMATFRILGDWLEDSGWIINANIAGSGVADSFLKMSDLKRTRHAHHLTAVALHILKCKGCSTYKVSIPKGVTAMDFQQWCRSMAKKYPPFL